LELIEDYDIGNQLPP
jgi:hypothetical protein